MLQDNRSVIWRGAIIALLIIASTACFLLYGRDNSYAPAPAAPSSGKPILNNPEVLQNWLPLPSFGYAVNRLDQYLTANSISAASLTFQDEVVPGANAQAYNFNVTTQPGAQTLSLAVTVSNLEGMISTAVAINGVLQTTTFSSSIQSSSGNTLDFSGIDTLASDGVTAAQITIFEQGVEKFIPAASGAIINTSTINPVIDQSTGNITYQFDLTVNGTTYNATLMCIGINQAQLLLANPLTKDTVFNTGIVTGAS